MLGKSVEIVATVYCGDNCFSSHRNEALKKILEIANENKAGMLVAGPAFTTGRYGFACVEICHSISNSARLNCVSAMNLENPEVGQFQAVILTTGD